VKKHAVFGFFKINR